ncbi:aromatic ring-hydroxylating dioxygenase subunit alpha [Rhizobium sp. FKL33]|uniref:aromatic ring-hydroxylating oxygenase subunit alpha n=1 Tax=Rhizobium sp. FKL33 TaxID=2562307 RepID=UPI001485A1E5|nr:aromatic ring-hydroxylating dioxygenase subunit alpha [Rhizobium sp. FKL33]
MKIEIPFPHQEVAQTRTLPGSFYADPEVFEAEKQDIFLKSWHYACPISALADNGAYVTIQILNQQVFLVRDQNDEIRGFFNVCPHRGHQLLEGSGQKRVITCPYHAWSYDLTGRLVAAREGGKSRTLVGSGICLKSVQVGTLASFVFVNLDATAEPFADYTAELARSINNVIPDLTDYKVRESVGYFGGDYDCNWKIAIDNYLECYHCETAHKSFCDMMDVKNSTFSLHDNFIYQFVPSGGKETNAAYSINLKEDALDGHFWFLFPNIIFSIFPGTKNFSVSWVDPVSAVSSLRKFVTMTPDGISKEREAARSRWGLEVLNEEDRQLCRSVQKGMVQRGFDMGYYLVDPRGNLSEDTVRHFHRIYLKWMFPVVSKV